VGAKLQVSQAWCECDGLPGFPRNAYRMDYIRKILKQGVIASALGENFNVAAVRSHRSAIYSKVRDIVDEV
jgi:hypothetical protein